MVRRLPFAGLLLVPSLIAAVDVAPPTEKPKEPIPAPVAAPRADPSATVVAEGRSVYRQRDLDALVLITQRHAKTKLSKTDEDQLRAVLLQALVAREPFVAVLNQLPVAVVKGRDAIALDLIDYQADPVKGPTPATPATASPAAALPAVAVPAAPAPAAASPLTPAPAVADKAATGVLTPTAPTAPAAAPRTFPQPEMLPPLVLPRTLPTYGKRVLEVEMWVNWPDQATVDRVAAKVPLLRDAVLGYLQALPAKDFAEPNQIKIKEGLTRAILAKIPEFPADGLLIPHLRGLADEAAAKPAAVEKAPDTLAPAAPAAPEKPAAADKPAVKPAAPASGK